VLLVTAGSAGLQTTAVAMASAIASWLVSAPDEAPEEPEEEEDDVEGDVASAATLDASPRWEGGDVDASSVAPPASSLLAPDWYWVGVAPALQAGRAMARATLTPALHHPIPRSGRRAVPIASSLVLTNTCIWSVRRKEKRGASAANVAFAHLAHGFGCRSILTM
jgi:hypothetical protein